MQSSHDLLESKVLKKEVDEELKDILMDKEADSDKSTSGAAPQKRQRLDLEQKEYNAEKESPVEVPKKEREHKFSPRKSREGVSESREHTDSDAIEIESAKPTLPNKAHPKLSAVEARRLKYTKGKKSEKEREEDTLNKLMAFRSTVQTTVEERKMASSSRKEQSRKVADDSLAARMARKALKSKNGSPEDNHAIQVPTYNGQVLESDDDDNDNDDDNNRGKDTTKKHQWLGTSFKCKRHMDQEAGKDLGGDGRAADDYEVVDMKNIKHQKGEKKHKHSRHHRDSKRSRHR